MSEYSRTRKLLGFSDIEMQELTGYTRQGLRYSFELLRKGKIPNPRFFTGLNAAIDAKTKLLEEEKQKIIDYFDSQLRQLASVRRGADRIQALRRERQEVVVHVDQGTYF